MESIVHRKFGKRVSFSFHSGGGIFNAHPNIKTIRWSTIICIIGYPKSPTIFSRCNFGISIEFTDKYNHNQKSQFEILSTTNEWEYRYFLEKTVIYLKKEYNAIGGKSWCSTFADKKLSNYYNSYVNCRTLANNQKITWFEQNDYDDIVVANDFLNNVLESGSSEYVQILTAIENTKLFIGKHGITSIWDSGGYHILYKRLRNC